jgi:hypothetical protein
VLPWRCGSTPFETEVRSYVTDEGDAVIFAQRWPEGATDTALGPAVPHLKSSPPSPSPLHAQERVLSAFPALTPPMAVAGSYAVVWNQMVGGMADGTRCVTCPLSVLGRKQTCC